MKDAKLPVGLAGQQGQLLEHGRTGPACKCYERFNISFIVQRLNTELKSIHCFLALVELFQIVMCNSRINHMTAPCVLETFHAIVACLGDPKIAGLRKLPRILALVDNHLDDALMQRTC